jgi:hypothetical protein
VIMNKELKRKEYYRRKASGICVKCLSNTVGATTMCAKHREIYRLKDEKYNKKYRERLVKERRCVRCATPLEEDEGRTCMNCSGKRERKEMIYAAHRVRFTA